MDIFEGLKDVVVPDSCWEPLPDNYSFNSEYQRQLARENALKRNANQWGGNNRNAGTWQVTYKDGRIVVIKALQRWATDNGYSVSGVKNLAYKKWKQYRDIQSIDRLLVTPEVSQ